MSFPGWVHRPGLECHDPRRAPLVEQRNAALAEPFRDALCLARPMLQQPLAITCVQCVQRVPPACGATGDRPPHLYADDPAVLFVAVVAPGDKVDRERVQVSRESRYVDWLRADNRFLWHRAQFGSVFGIAKPAPMMPGTARACRLDFTTLHTIANGRRVVIHRHHDCGRTSAQFTLPSICDNRFRQRPCPASSVTISL